MSTLTTDMREKLINACALDAANSLANDRGFRESVARGGFAGFAHLNDAELTQAFLDAGLDEQYPDLGGQITGQDGAEDAPSP